MDRILRIVRLGIHSRGHFYFFLKMFSKKKNTISKLIKNGKTNHNEICIESDLDSS